MQLRDALFSSESVTEGHPDKVCDQISDAVLDECLRQDKSSRVALETAVKTGLVLLIGEITTRARLEYPNIVRRTVDRIGFNDGSMGFDARSCAVMVAVEQQSPEIAMGVDSGANKEQGAGDQESQVTVEYRGGRPHKVQAVVIAAQHEDSVSTEHLREAINAEVIDKVVPAELRAPDMKRMINATGRFIIGGPMGDSGVTGRKIIVDTYGGMGHHGGGAFSGKDPSKVDRSAAYAARWVAKSVVAAGLARRCEVQVAYAIGVAEPVSIMVETFGTHVVPEEKIEKAVRATFSLKPASIIRDLDLLRPIFEKTAAYGHFGRSEPEFTWERTDRSDALRQAAGLKGAA
ncbi:MAG: methionine adenosyltransferase [Deltaproteobacteria bacterium]|nr:MAG: methionine adenosyltransferase [Deltaproteobacteria bacterium]